MNYAYKGLGRIIASLYEPLKAKNGHFNGSKAISLALPRLLVSGKLTGKESILAFRAEKENKPVCFGCYSGWEACPATRRRGWPEECKVCKKLNQIRRSI